MSGIGKAVAQNLARQGAHVVLHGRDQARGEALAKEIAAEGDTARFVAADLTDAEDTLRLAAEAGAVDVLVSNAGLYEFTPTAPRPESPRREHLRHRRGSSAVARPSRRVTCDVWPRRWLRRCGGPQLVHGDSGRLPRPMCFVGGRV
ncbi:SDR family NAD(P)-dependent oxidoreductase [Streptomyces sp. NPDC054995]